MVVEHSPGNNQSSSLDRRGTPYESLAGAPRHEKFSLITSVRALSRRLRSMDKEGVSDFEAYSLPEAREFWDHGSVEQAESFEIQLQQLKHEQVGSRQNVIRARDKDILDATIARTKRVFTEKEGMEDLGNFLQQVVEVASEEVDPEAQAMKELAQAMRSELTFLDKAEFDEGCHGIARLWLEYMRQSKENILNIYNKSDNGRKSYNIVLQKIVDNFTALTQNDPHVRHQLRLDVAEWQDTPTAKLIVVDDWAVSGATLQGNMKEAMNTAKRSSTPALADKAEAHLLMVRPSQKNESWYVGQQKFAVRGYYQTSESKRDNVYAVSVSGSHSSVDYGFETPLYTMNRFLSSRGVYREAPLLTGIEREYGEMGPYDSTAEAVLTEIGSLNGLYNRLKTEEASLTNELDGTSLSLEARNHHTQILASTRHSLDAIRQRRDTLVLKYEQRLLVI